MWSPRADLARLRSVGPGDVPALAGLALLIPVVWVTLRLAGFGRLDRAIGRLPAWSTPARRARAVRRAPRLAQLAAIASRRSLVPSTCLARSLALRLVLHVRGVPTTVRLGVRPSAGPGLDAHSWLELDGVPLDDAADVAERYAPLDRPPA